MNEVMGIAWAMLIFSAVTCVVVVLANVRRVRRARKGGEDNES